VGGVLIDTTGWRYIFLMNVPIGIFGTVWAHLRLREIAKTEKRSRFDYLGLLLFTTSLTTLLLVISLLTMAAIDNVEATIFFTIGLATFAGFLYVEPRAAQPLLDMRLFKIRLFSAGNISQFLYSLGFGSLSLIIILYFQLIRGFDALTAGILFLPLDVAFVIIGPISGRLSDRYGTRGLATLGMGVGTVGYVALVFLLTATTPLLQVEIILIIIGLGLGLFSSPNISAVMGSVPADRRGVASAVRATLFNTGNVVSIALVAYIITTAIPYQVVSGIITGGYTTLTASDSVGFITGIGRAFIVAAVITLVGMFASSLRGHETKTQTNHTQQS
jgi:MFS family permease